jgi:2-polyprenyl-3-methyl-5-hydroxy-6-metoxy-1,4-benzoquinol methylase
MATSLRRGVWTADVIARFWDHLGEGSPADYFSYQVGEGIVNLLIQSGHLRRGVRVLDYGCGPGFLLERVLARGALCSAVDASPKSIDLINQRFRTNRSWLGGSVVLDPPTQFSDSTFDLVTCVEVLEHLCEERAAKVILEIYRLLVPGGVALFTTPHEEDLSRNSVLCPFCDTHFHKVQHVRSFARADLGGLLTSHGFEVIFCRDLDFAEFQRHLPKWTDWSPRILWYSARRHACRVMDRLVPTEFPGTKTFELLAAPGPHLCAMVRRRP